ncbi:MAG TPA: outer membrane protein assembly factor BamB [Ramlibacter sp.]|nr:outer membrane protein assembly factor BamB [Ramlibacter sp.]
MTGRALRISVAAVALSLGVSGCSMMPSFLGGGVEKPKPADLGPNVALIAVRQAWTNHVGPVTDPMAINVSGATITVSGSDGTVAAIDAASGRDLWRASVGGPIAAGAGSDGTVAAVVTRANELVALSRGKQLWRQKLTAVAYTPPFVAGGRVFVQTADRAVSAFDGRTGHKLWTQQRPGEPLVLHHAGVMLAVGNTLVVGLSGRLAGLDPLTGAIRWEAPIATPRGINDVERLVDLVAPVSRVGDSICARAFQAAVGCADTSRGTVQWTKPANGAEGLSGDGSFVFGTEADGKVMAWQRADGERAWESDRLRYRTLTAPLALGRSVVIGDDTGLVHMLSRSDGSPLNRLTPDGSAIMAAPVVAGNTLVVLTRNGGVFGYVPE